MASYENTFKYLKSDSQNYETEEHITAAADTREARSIVEDQGPPEEIESNKESRKRIARWFADDDKNSC